MQLIFLTGLPRSGTTWAGRALAAATGSVIVDEPFNRKWHPERTGYRLKYLTAGMPDAEMIPILRREIHHWRSLYPVAGTRAELVPPPGWRAPKDWASYPIPLDDLQEQPAPGMPPAHALTPLDWQHGEAGRLKYNCEPYRMLGGGLCK